MNPERKNFILVMAAAAIFAVTTAALAALTEALPDEQAQGTVHYMTGGRSRAEARAMREAMMRYPLALEFVEGPRNHREFLATVQVTIQDANGARIFDGVSGGPYLFLRLDAGRYEISAAHAGRTEHREVEVPATGMKRVVFAWK